MKTSKVFAIARRGVSLDGRDPRTRYICNSISDARRDGLITARDMVRTKNIITKLLTCDSYQLGNCLENWLRAVKDINPTSSVDDRKKMQVTRHAWLDSLIAEYTARGD